MRYASRVIRAASSNLLLEHWFGPTGTISFRSKPHPGPTQSYQGEHHPDQTDIVRLALVPVHDARSLRKIPFLFPSHGGRHSCDLVGWGYTNGRRTAPRQMMRPRRL